MKKNLFQLMILSVLLSLVSCGGGDNAYEADVRKMAKYRCEMEKLTQAEENEANQKKAEDLQKEMNDFAESFSKKYADRVDDKQVQDKARKIMDEEMAKCK